MNTLLILVALCGMTGCVNYPTPRYEEQVVIIRGMDGYHNIFTAETESHEIKMFDVCGRTPPPVWTGETFQIYFYWNANRTGTDGIGCYQIQSAKRITGGTK